MDYMLSEMMEAIYNQKSNRWHHIYSLDGELQKKHCLGLGGKLGFPKTEKKSEGKRKIPRVLNALAHTCQVGDMVGYLDRKGEGRTMVQ